MLKKSQPNERKEIDAINVLYETAHAEYGSALEMLAACKKSANASIAYGYFYHSKDEYTHTSKFFKMLSHRGKKVRTKIAKSFRFRPYSVLSKGYISKHGFLIDYLKTKDFIAFVYTNELLAKSSFDKILKLVGPSTEDGQIIKNIMDDELRHHGMAKKHFLKYYPRLQPWQLRVYKIREILKNKSRKFHSQNMRFLEIIFRPIYNLLSYMIGTIFVFLDVSKFRREGKNLMAISTDSVI